jgi:small subunit ribosomal protein S15
MKINKKDLVTKRSLIALVGKRKRMLEYLKEQDIERYRAIIKKLGLRK